MPVSELDGQRFAADHGVGEVDRVRNGVAFSGIDSDKFVALAHFERAQNANVCPGAALFANTGAADEIHKRPRASVKNGQFKVIQLDDGIVNSHANESREQMLSGRDEHALFHQTGGVTDARHVATDGLEFKAVKISTPEDNTGVRSGRQDAQGDWRTGM